uniref:asparagine synthase (glutamine-hydrolyzing) n=1 Tax=Methylogaea oryzae TaxID=1295382 RepID=UPI0006D146CE
MCGIAGFAGEGSREDVVAMNTALAHRGPDGEGYHEDAARRLFLAHRRLAVLDIQAGTQPMWNEDGRVCVVFNGEIYNHAELRQELLGKGHVFRSHHSDTEVLVHGYEEWGDGLPLRLNGMFAFAVYDAGRGRLFLARDRFGEKPLYYFSSPKLFAFGSEVTALRRHSGINPAIDTLALQKFFAYSFIPAPHSLYQGIRKLPPGHALSCDLATLRTSEREYWRFRIEPFETVPADAESAWREELRHLLRQAVKRRLASDVPLGLFTSGGIDSSAMLAYAAAESGAQPIETFAIGFREASYDESPHARRIAHAFGSAHHEEILDIDKARELIPDVLRRLDEPMADASIVPTYLLCKFARQHVTVALGGDGGDELFAGYDPFRALRLAGWYRRLVPGWGHKLIQSCAAGLPVSDANMNFSFKLQRALRGAGHGPAFWNPVWLGAVGPDELEQLCNEPISPEALYQEAIAAWESSSADNVVDRSLEFYTRFYLPDDILTKVDRASMMVSLEVRTPFLDNDLADFARRLPHTFKLRGGCGKYLLKQALRGVIPEALSGAPKKASACPSPAGCATGRCPPRPR